MALTEMSTRITERFVERYLQPAGTRALQYSRNMKNDRTRKDHNEQASEKNWLR